MAEPIPLVDLHAQYEPLAEEIRQAWDEALAGMRLFLGPNVQALEREFAAYCGVPHAIGVSDGTAALHLALRACEVGPGDEVITVSHTFIATVEAIRLAGARPVFVDVDPRTYTMDAGQVEACITPRTRAVLPVHLYGQCADMDPLLEIAGRRGLRVIEDACQAHGGWYGERRAGALGDVAAFSFYYSKNLGAYGEGGMVTTGDDALARRVQMLRDHGSDERYRHDLIGLNGRLDELQAAALRIKLRHLDEWNALRRAHGARYGEALQRLQGLQGPQGLHGLQGRQALGVRTPTEAPYGQHVYHLYVIRTRERDALRAWLDERGIGTGIHYPIPCHLQRACADLGYVEGSLPVTEALAGEILSLPMYPELTDAQIDRVVAEIGNWVTG